ncbi:MAG: tRNA pseudouridine(38-40) synthase TruA [Anaerolineae bacterium]|nr:tRNA pseudouridine(38-40) synthase TruA [Anaerolineae bacterium]
MKRYRAILAYNGSAYFGYQRQPEHPTVQAAVEEALEKVLGVKTVVRAAGRTDTGVHATGQVIAFDAVWKHGEATLLKAVNVYLPEDIALQTLVQHDDFHPRYDALSRTYRYAVVVVNVRQPLLAKRAWQLHTELDEQRLQEAAALLIGEHDFAAFGTPPKGDNTVRLVYRSQWQPMTLEGVAGYTYEVEATAFLYHMVRRIVGSLVAVGRGQISLQAFETMFRSADLSQNKWMAPPQGLVLTSVRYPAPGEDSPRRTRVEREPHAT